MVLAPFSSITSLARDFWLVHIMSSKAPPLALVQPGDPLGAVAPSESRPLRRALVWHPPRAPKSRVRQVRQASAPG